MPNNYDIKYDAKLVMPVKKDKYKKPLPQKFSKRYNTSYIEGKSKKGRIYKRKVSLNKFNRDVSIEIYNEIQEIRKILKRNQKELGIELFLKCMAPLRNRLNNLRHNLKHHEFIISLGRFSVTKDKYKEQYFKNEFDQTGNQKKKVLNDLKFMIKHDRIRNKQLRYRTKSYNLIRYKTYGRTFNKNGTILNMIVDKKTNAMWDGKKPRSNENHVGVELEFCSTITQKELARELYKLGVADNCQILEDGSLRPMTNEIGHEIAIVAPQDKIQRIVTKVTDKLKELGAETEDRRCGLHVHLDMRNRDHEKCYQNLISCQRYMFDMMPEHRSGNEFCRRIGRKRKFPEKLRNQQRYDSRRYESINAQSYYKHKTIEVRMHEGTVDSGSINNWIKFLLKVIDCPEKITKAFSSMIKMEKKLNLDTELSDYVKRRIKDNKHSGMVGLRRLSSFATVNTNEALERVASVTTELAYQLDQSIPTINEIAESVQRERNEQLYRAYERINEGE